jgi:hypothetical protein
MAARRAGWIHTLLEEAENERMHLITFLELRKPGPLFRAAVIGAQGVFFNAYFLAYLLAPRTCHAFIGFLEEEAVKTYTHALAEIDAGRLWRGKSAPRIAVQYWGLPEGATMRGTAAAGYGVRLHGRLKTRVVACGSMGVLLVAWRQSRHARLG